MPNWTSNRLYAEGSPEQISEFLETVKGKNGVLDFNAIIPAPELLSHTASGARNVDGKEVTEWYVIAEADHVENRPAKVRIFTPDEEAELNNISHRSWYDWNRNNWGTKWNACDPEIEDEASKQYGYVRITYMTAWCEPLPVLQKLAVMFPHLCFIFEWRHEDESEFPHTLHYEPDAKGGG
jgi:hypothetical protein